MCNGLLDRSLMSYFLFQHGKITFISFLQMNVECILGLQHNILKYLDRGRPVGVTPA